MKNKAFTGLLAILLLITLLMPLSSLAALQHVDDQANLLTSDQRADLQKKAADLYERSGFDIIIHTTRNSQNKTPFDYTMDFYHGFRDAAAYPNGAALAIMMDTRDYYEAARGTGIKLLSQQGSHNLADIVQARLSDGDYHGAFANYIRTVRRTLIPLTPFERMLEFAPYILGAGLLIGLGYGIYLRSKLKIAKFKSGADLYIVPNSLNLTENQDLYLYQTVTRTKIQQSSGGGGGGGFSSGSRGGTSYGGRGGKF